MSLQLARFPISDTRKQRKAPPTFPNQPRRRRTSATPTQTPTCSSTPLMHGSSSLRVIRSPLDKLSSSRTTLRRPTPPSRPFSAPPDHDLNPPPKVCSSCAAPDAPCQPTPLRSAGLPQSHNPLYTPPPLHPAVSQRRGSHPLVLLVHQVHHRATLAPTRILTPPLCTPRTPLTAVSATVAGWPALTAVPGSDRSDLSTVLLTPTTPSLPCGRGRPLLPTSVCRMDAAQRSGSVAALNKMAHVYYASPHIADCRLLVPIDSNAGSASGGPDSPGIGRSVANPTHPTPRTSPSSSSSCSASSSLEDNNLGVPLSPTSTFRSYSLHKDYLTTQSSVLRNLLCGCHPATATKGVTVLPTSPGQPLTIVVPLPDPSSFGVLLHWIYFGDVAALERALSSEAVSWRGVIKNIEFLGLDDRTKGVVALWWRRYVAPAQGEESHVPCRSGASAGETQHSPHTDRYSDSDDGDDEYDEDEYEDDGMSTEVPYQSHILSESASPGPMQDDDDEVLHDEPEHDQNVD